VHAERSIAVTTHGRFLLDAVEGVDPSLLVTGFHGYAEQAAIQLERLRALRGASPFTLVSIQGLHRFYRNNGEDIAASWMTREDRELAIADNITYVDNVLDAIVWELGEPPGTVHVGFSQGASMAYRAAALGARTCRGVIAVGGDIPPELGSGELSRIPSALILRGTRDRFYTAAALEADAARLRAAGVQVQLAELDTGHEWTDAATDAARTWLLTVA
jgi:predicted esterase